jgi:hypothetical protein
LLRKTDNVETQRVWEEFKKYSSYDDLKDLYNKVMPTLKNYEQKMMVMGNEYEQSKEMIRRYDEILSEKANKMAIIEVYEHCNKYVQGF